MNKHLVVISLVCLLICFGLSGCTQNSGITGDTDKVTVSVDGIKTKWYIGAYDQGIKQYPDIVANGFYHDYPNDADDIRYEITGSVKNIVDRPINICFINATFSDEEGNVLGIISYCVSDLFMDESKDFKISVGEIDLAYFEHAEKYTLEVYVTLH